MKYCGALLLVLSVMGCGKQQWPAGTGYLNEGENRPSKPHDVEPTDETVTIREDLGAGMLEVDGTVPIHDGKATLAFPGTTIVQANRSKENMTLQDFNGDPCVIPYGMTVTVDSYGQVTPVHYSPE